MKIKSHSGLTLPEFALKAYMKEKHKYFSMCKNFHFYTCLEKDSGNCSATQWTWSAGWIVFGKHP